MNGQLRVMIEASNHIVFFGGAGVSTESGIPDFRGQDGLFRQSYAHPPETILSHSFFLRHTEEFYRFYRDKMLCTKARPNRAHTALAELERRGKLKGIITQNIDGLHQMAGSVNVLELHGSVHRNTCLHCQKTYPLETVEQCAGVPRCAVCGGVVKPDVVLYEEGLDEALLEQAVQWLQTADMLIVGGTSLRVYPAAGLLDWYQGHKLVLINKTETAYDSQADLVIRGGIGEVLGDAVTDTEKPAR